MSKREVKIFALEIAISTLLKIRIEDAQERKERESEHLGEILKSPFVDED